MKIILLLTLVWLSYEILDRSYYDALGRSYFMKNFRLVPVKIKLKMLLEDYLRFIILIEILDHGPDSKKLTMVPDK